MKDRLGGECRHRPAAKINLGHRDPCRELADRFGDQAGGERSQIPRHGKRSARAHAGLEVDDPVDKGESREVIVHAVLESLGSQAAAGASRCDWITSLQKVSGVNSRGMSATFIGLPNRSAGISDK